ncbi:bifunctional (p)ppGpp synthetase/guanosine-3',5'-bis(diphosphate) 3'-pyrophosphohydrolase [Amorphus sp. 3PC139-8]
MPPLAQAGDIPRLFDALQFAARAHANQRRKGAAQEPYINHLIEVAKLVADATGGSDTDLVIAALLHDAIEDTGTTYGALAAHFGPRVAELVRENSDDMALPKPERRRRRIAEAAHKSDGAKIIKIADLISNARAMITSPPAGWAVAWKLDYLEATQALHNELQGVNEDLDRIFSSVFEEVREVLTGDGLAADSDVPSGPAALLDSALGQAVHFVYFANTSAHPLTEEDRTHFYAQVGEHFPSVTYIDAEAVFDGVRRPVILARIRSDSTEAVVALAQRLCVAMHERFIGVEVDGRYIRIYADDTGQ